MTQIIYENGHITVIQSHVQIEFRVCDLTSASRNQLINSVTDIK